MPAKLLKGFSQMNMKHILKANVFPACIAEAVQLCDGAVLLEKGILDVQCELVEGLLCGFLDAYSNDEMCEKSAMDARELVPLLSMVANAEQNARLSTVLSILCCESVVAADDSGSDKSFERAIAEVNTMRGEVFVKVLHGHEAKSKFINKASEANARIKTFQNSSKMCKEALTFLDLHRASADLCDIKVEDLERHVHACDCCPPELHARLRGGFLMLFRSLFGHAFAKQFDP
jgi:hypothetical protein